MTAPPPPLFDVLPVPRGDVALEFSDEDKIFNMFGVELRQFMAVGRVRSEAMPLGNELRLTVSSSRDELESA